jgi:hypothetical protein
MLESSPDASWSACVVIKSTSLRMQQLTLVFVDKLADVVLLSARLEALLPVDSGLLGGDVATGNVDFVSLLDRHDED